MIKGMITPDREAILHLQVIGPTGQSQEFQATIDTGYNGYLTLNRQVVTALRLPFAGYRRATLADGSKVLLEAFLAQVMWHGSEREVVIAHTEGTPLIGMSLLYGSRLTLEILDEGEVTIEEVT